MFKIIFIRPVLHVKHSPTTRRSS